MTPEDIRQASMIFQRIAADMKEDRMQAQIERSLSRVEAGERYKERLP